MKTNTFRSKWMSIQSKIYWLEWASGFVKGVMYYFTGLGVLFYVMGLLMNLFGSERITEFIQKRPALCGVLAVFGAGGTVFGLLKTHEKLISALHDAQYKATIHAA